MPKSYPPLILGSNVLGWNVDKPSSEKLLDAAMAAGLTAFDTADVYSYWASGNKGGESETIIGDWMASRGTRGKVQIHTKGGAPGAPGELANANATAAYLTQAVEASLKRLRTDHIDLYYVHYDDKVTPLDETLRGLEKLVTSGKVGALGASNYAPPRLADAIGAAAGHKLTGFSVLQTEYNLCVRKDFEQGLKPLCEQAGLSVMAYFALAKGFLSGKYRSKADAAKSAARGEGATAYLNPQGLRILAALDKLAAERNASCAQLALAWLIAKPNVHPIASATSMVQIDDLAAATRLKLAPAEVAELDKASA